MKERLKDNKQLILISSIIGAFIIIGGTCALFALVVLSSDAISKTTAALKAPPSTPKATRTPHPTYTATPNLPAGAPVPARTTTFPSATATPIPSPAKKIPPLIGATGTIKSPPPSFETPTPLPYPVAVSEKTTALIQASEDLQTLLQSPETDDADWIFAVVMQSGYLRSIRNELTKLDVPSTKTEFHAKLLIALNDCYLAVNYLKPVVPTGGKPFNPQNADLEQAESLLASCRDKLRSVRSEIDSTLPTFIETPLENLSYSDDPETIIIYANASVFPGAPYPEQLCKHIPDLRIWGDGRIVSVRHSMGGREVRSGHISSAQIQEILAFLYDKTLSVPATPEMLSPAGTGYDISVELNGISIWRYWLNKPQVYSELMKIVDHFELPELVPQKPCF